MGYALIVGLISVVALASISGSGSAVNSLFGTTSDALGGTLSDASSSSGAAAAQPSASASPTPYLCSNGTTHEASTNLSNGDILYVCRADRASELNIVNNHTTCPALSEFVDDHWLFSDGSTMLGAVRWEVVPVSAQSGFSPTGYDRFTRQCLNFNCTSTQQSGSTTISSSGSTLPYIDAHTCMISLDGQDMTGTDSAYWINIGPSNATPANIRVNDWAHLSMGGTNRIEEIGLSTGAENRIRTYRWLRHYQSTASGGSASASGAFYFAERVTP
ncbi:MAG: hypothetical protein Alpg2KO_31870 [Alphaproteobacteria bacterium]